MQLIILVESNKQSQSDYKYIYKTLKHYFNIDVKLSPIFLGSKNNYNKKEKEINDKKSRYSSESHVIVCIDIDQPYLNPLQQKLNEEIEKYCELNNYELVWFNESIEDVFIKTRVESKLKVKESDKFSQNGIVPSINILSNKSISKQSSNILNVFIKYLKYK